MTLTYIQWIHAIDAILFEEQGRGGWSYPLSTPWPQWYADGLTPREAINTLVHYKTTGGFNA